MRGANRFGKLLEVPFWRESDTAGKQEANQDNCTGSQHVTVETQTEPVDVQRRSDSPMTASQYIVHHSHHHSIQCSHDINCFTTSVFKAKSYNCVSFVSVWPTCFLSVVQCDGKRNIIVMLPIVALILLLVQEAASLLSQAHSRGEG